MKKWFYPMIQKRSAIRVLLDYSMPLPRSAFEKTALAVRALCVAWLLFTFSACSANPLAGMNIEGLREQIEDPDLDLFRSIERSSEAQVGLRAIHPGAQFYLGESLMEKKAYAEAVRFFRIQIEAGVPAWVGISFRSWLKGLVALKDWNEIIEQGPGLFDGLYGSSGTARGDNPSSHAEAGLARETWNRTYLDALSQLKRWSDVHAHIGAIRDGYLSNAPPVAMGEAPYPSWIAYHQARSALMLHLKGNRKPQWTTELYEAVSPYFLYFDARAGHTELFRLSGALLNQGLSADETLKVRALIQVARIKDLLARNQAPLAFEASRAVFAPSETRRLTRGYRLLIESSSLPPSSVIADFYDSARLSGRLSDGTALMGQVADALLGPVPALKAGPLLPYTLELKARLTRFKSDHPAALVLFKAAVNAGFAAEKNGVYAPADRRRAQWYLLRSFTDQSLDLSTDDLFSVGDFIAEGIRTDDPEYFSDVFERALLAAGGRGDWQAVARMAEALSSVMDNTSRVKFGLVVARQLQVDGLLRPSDRDTFDTYTRAAVEQKLSLYYHAVGLWMRGEALDVMAFIRSQSRLVDSGILDPLPEESSLRTWEESISKGYWDMGMYDQGFTYSWENRQAISFAWFTQLGRNYITMGRYRQGLRFLESVRLRAGHPPDSDVLEDFYPRPYEPELLAAVAGKTVPDWLMYSMVRTESNFDTSARSGPGAQGLAQLMPATAEAVAQGLGLQDANILEPGINLRIGAQHLHDHYLRTKSWPQSLAAYNAGQGRVGTWIRAGLTQDPLLFSELIPFDETRNYLRRIVESSLIYTYLAGDLDPGTLLSYLLR